MTTTIQARNFFQRVYQNVWQPYAADQLTTYYHRNFNARTGTKTFACEQFHALLNTNKQYFSNMQTDLHYITTQGDNRMLAWFTSKHFDKQGASVYQLNTMASYVITNDKITTVEFTWDLPCSFVMQALPHAITYLNQQFPQCAAKLTQRELQCCFYLLQGYTAKQIAQTLQRSYRTIEEHIARLKDKLALTSTRDLLAYGHTHHLIALAPLYTHILHLTH